MWIKIRHKRESAEERKKEGRGGRPDGEGNKTGHGLLGNFKVFQLKQVKIDRTVGIIFRANEWLNTDLQRSRRRVSNNRTS